MKLCGICRLEKVESMEKILDLISKKVMDAFEGCGYEASYGKVGIRTGRIYVNTVQRSNGRSKKI